MKKRFFAFSLIFLFLLSSCSMDGGDTDELSSFLSTLENAEYTADITANFPSREASFTISFVATPEKTRACVISPSEVAGVSYSVSPDGATLEFDGAILEIGRLEDGGISPFSCIPTLLSSWRGGDFAEISPCTIFGEKAYLVISCEDKNSVPIEYRTWFSKDDFSPLYAEIFSDGERVITCNFERGKHTEDEHTKEN